jgi:hypothetical protein
MARRRIHACHVRRRIHAYIVRYLHAKDFPRILSRGEREGRERQERDGGGWGWGVTEEHWDLR